MQTVIPQLRMTDADRSLAFYAAPGFTVDREHRFEADLPLFARLTRDGQTIFPSGHAAIAPSAARCISRCATSTSTSVRVRLPRPACRS